MNSQNAAGMTVGLRRTLIALVTVVAVVMAAAFGLKQLPMAKADPVDVTISDVTIAKQGDGSELTKGNVVDVRMNWEANGPFNAGDTFEVDFPATFKPQSIDSFDLKDENNVVGGTCSVASGAQTLVCTLNEEFTEKENVKGLIGLRAQAEAASEDEEFPFTVRGKQETTPVANVPGGVKEQGDITDYTGVENLEKSAHIASLSDEYLIWDILIPYESFKDADQIVITDTIKGTNHKHVDAHAPDGTVRAGATQRDAQNQQSYMNENFEVVSDQELRVTLSPFSAGTKDGNGKEYDGTWEEGQDIYLTYWTQRLNEVTKEGDTYSNNISVNADGNVTEASASMFWNTDGFGTIEGVNTGSFSLTKTVEVEGGEPCEALEGASFPVNVTITLPVGFEENDYPNSEGRGNREGNVITYTDYVQDGATIRGYDRLPAGTTVAFSETQPEIEGVTFQEPVFSQQSIIIEDENSSNVAVTLTNPAQCTPEAPATGGFTVNKVVEGVDEEDAEAFNNIQFPITTNITSAEGEELDPVEGTISVNGEELTGEAPVGATVVITEGGPEGELPEGYTFDGATITIDGEETNEFTIAEGEETNVEVTVNNRYTKDTPPTDGETPPTDGETPPTDGETPPTDGETPPTDGETPPTDGETPPTDGETPPTDGETPPTDGETPPTDGETP
ncbi:hypothetical protein KBX10_11020, partial [Corynebacterium sp. CCUG 59401]|nr:hypothetical protein [Corynebacterium pseudogenitalium]